MGEKCGMAVYNLFLFVYSLKMAVFSQLLIFDKCKKWVCIKNNKLARCVLYGIDVAV